jgi:hypothetical protein
MAQRIKDGPPALAQVVILQPASGVEVERKIPADVGGSNRVAARWRERMEVHNAHLKSAARRWQLPGVGYAEYHKMRFAYRSLSFFLKLKNLDRLYLSISNCQK